jgi:histidine kinase
MQILPGYQLNETIYEDELYIICRVNHAENKNSFLAKKLKTKSPSNQELANFHHEVRVLKDNDMDGVPKVISHIELGGHYTILSEDFDGITLQQFLGESPISISQFLDIAIKLAEVVAQVHQKGLVHKNINASTILLSKGTMELRLIDFSASSNAKSELIQLGGNPLSLLVLPYKAPEQTGRLNQSIDHRSDFYSMGVVLYQLATGRLPFESDDLLELVHAHIAKIPESPALHNPSFPEALCKIILKLLEKSNDRRYQSSSGLIHDLIHSHESYSQKGFIADFQPGSLDYSQNLRIPEKIYGRKKDLEVLGHCLTRLYEGNQTSLFINGEAGVGKTKLVSELKKQVISRKGVFIEGKFDQFNKNVPYSAIVAAFNDMIGQILQSKSEDLAELKDLFVAQLGQNLGIIVDLLPNSRFIFGDVPPPPPLAGKESENRFRLTVRQFIQVFSRKVKPMTIFLDDIQWADPGSLNLTKWLLENPSGNHTLFVCAYRKEAVQQNPIFEKWLMGIDFQSDNRVLLELHPLEKEDVQELLADVFLSTPEEVTAIAKVIFQKTDGNPFFISEILRQIQSEGILTLDINPDKISWKWDLEKINNLKITDNVVDLVLRRTLSLRKETLEVLSAAACVNKTFDLETVSEIFPEKTSEAIGEALKEALESELIYPVDENHRFILLSGISINAAFSFSHDRVQQAIYAINPVEASRKTHLKLANLGLLKLHESSESNLLLEVAAHFLIAAPLLTTPEQKLAASEILVMAGVKTKENNAPAAPFLNVAIDLLPENTWEEKPSLTFMAYYTLGESEFITGNPELAEQIFVEIEKNAPLLHQKIAAICQKMVVYLSTFRYEMAIQEGKEGLQLLGYSMPEPSEQAIGMGLGEVMGLLGGKKMEEILSMAPIQDQQVILANNILAIILPSAFLSGNGTLWTVTVLEMTKVLLSKGLSQPGALGLSSFGMIMGSILGDRNKAYELGEVAIQITASLNDQTRDAQLKFVHGAFLATWIKDSSYLTELLDESIADGLKFGDLAYAGFSYQVKIGLGIYLGKPLGEFLEMIERDQPILKTLDKEDANLLKEFIKNLLQGEHHDLPESELISGSALDARVGEMMAKKLYNVVGISLNLHCTLSNLHQNPQEVLNRYALLSQLEEAYFSNIMVAAIKLQFFIAKATLFLQKQIEDSSQELTAVLTWMESQNQSNNKFFRNALAQMQAYMGWITEGEETAIFLFNKALDVAKETDHALNSGRIHEVLFRIYMAHNNTPMARSHFGEALIAYNKFGAIKKIREIREEFPQLSFEVRSIPFKPGENAFASEAHLDYLSIIKSSQVLSAEIDIESLLKSLLQISRENAGAQRGRYLKFEHGGFTIQSEIGSWNDLSSSLVLPEGLINFVIHTQETVFIDDAGMNEQFGQDPYFLKNSIKSVICVPVKFKQKLKGLIYLENNLIYGAFGQNTIELLKLLSTQIGISIENAELYTYLEETNKNLEQKVKERTHELSKLYSENEMLLLNMLPSSIAKRLKSGETFIADSYENVSVIFVDIVNFTVISENLSPKALVAEIHEYFKTFDKIIEHHGLEKIKTIGDAYLAVSGLPVTTPDHAIKCIEVAKQMLQIMKYKQANGGLFEVRVGISSGPVVAGVVGEKKFAYDIWGDTVNTAARMEQNSQPGQINLSGSTFELVKDRISCTYRGKLPAKNKGDIDMYFVKLD